MLYIVLLSARAPVRAVRHQVFSYALGVGRAIVAPHLAEALQYRPWMDVGEQTWIWTQSHVSALLRAPPVPQRHLGEQGPQNLG